MNMLRSNRDHSTALCRKRPATWSHSQWILSALFLASCASSDEAARQRTGAISGKVEEVLHHGAFNPDGPNQTITALANVPLVLSDTTGAFIDTLVTRADGAFSKELAAGVYVLSPPERTNESVPGSSPARQRVIVRAGETTTVLLRYQVYAP